jgi:hypothetical protein
VGRLGPRARGRLHGLLSLAIGGALISRTGKRLTDAYERSGGELTGEVRPVAARLLNLMRLETLVVALVIVDMSSGPAGRRVRRAPSAARSGRRRPSR